MNRVVLDSARLHLEIEPDVGAGIADFSLRRPDGALWPLMRRAPERVMWFNDLACYTLVPWCNRIAAARFRFRGREYTLRPDWPDGTAIHGDAKHRPWRVLDRSSVAARFGIESRDVGDPNWPWPCAARARYDLFDDQLVIDMSVRNLGDAPMPAGIGLHPFWMRALTAGEDCEGHSSIRARYPAVGMIPTGPAREDDLTRRLATGGTLGSLAVDDVFACGDPSEKAGWATIRWPRSGIQARIDCSANLRHAVVYSRVEAGRPAPWFCLEPVSMVNDGFNLLERGQEGTGVAVLGSGEAMEARAAIRVSALG